MRPTSSLNPISALRLAGLVALCSVVVVAGTSAAPGPHLSWDRCWGDGQVANKVFACNTNTGAEVLVISYESPVAVSGITGVEAELGIFYTGFIPPSGVTFPAWWEVFGSGRCRSTASAVILAGAPTSLCVDPYQGLAQGGLAALRVDTQPTSTGSARLSMGVAVPPQTSWSVGPGTEDFLLELRISHRGTTGAGACDGCGSYRIMSIGFIRLLGPAGIPTIMLSPLSDGASYVSWQGFAVPTRQSSWGSVKALYH